MPEDARPTQTAPKMEKDAAMKPLPPVSVHFLGTCAGSGPTTSRHCSSLAVDFGSETWLFDVADGTAIRLIESNLKPRNITRIFITHLHADHVMGLVAAMIEILWNSNSQTLPIDRTKPAKLNVYGPRGIRKLVRTSLELTHMTLADSFAVHELLLPNETQSALAQATEDTLEAELVGDDLRPDGDGVWRNVLTEGNGKSKRGWAVHAGPIEHRITSLGFILQEPTPLLPLDTATLVPLLRSNATALAQLDPPITQPLSLLSHLTSLPLPPPYTLPSRDVIHPPGPSGQRPRKILIFGDCTGGTKNSAFQTMCEEPSLLIHECTNAAISSYISGKKTKAFSETRAGPSKTRSESASTQDTLDVGWRREQVEASGKALSRGHSSPLEVGAFANAVKARRVALNHFSSQFVSPRYVTNDPFPSINIFMPTPPLPPPLSTAATATSPKESLGTPHPASESNTVEIRVRMTMQSIVDQVAEIWDSPLPRPRAVSELTAGLSAVSLDQGDSDPVTSKTSPNYQDRDLLRLPVATRDFMVMTLTSHELSESECEITRNAVLEGKSLNDQLQAQ